MKVRGWVFFAVFVLMGFGGILGCAAAQVALEHKDLDVQTKMSDTIFLDPVGDDKKTIYLDIKNTSDKDIKVADKIRASLESRGYKIAKNPNSAFYYLQANILQVGKTDPSAAQHALHNGYGGALLGAGLGATSAGSDYYRGAVVGGVIGGAAEMVANSLVKNVTYSTITDVQISLKSSHAVKQHETASLAQGTSGHISQNISSTGNRIKYRTRVVSTANKVNLKFEEALPLLEETLARSLAGVF